MSRDALRQAVLTAVREQRLLAPGDTVLATVSGGADSMTLLHLLLALREELSLAGVEAIHVHHGLRGAEADRDETFVREQCAAWGVPLTVYHRDVAALARERGGGREEAGRAARYACFEEARAGRPNVKIATAHTRSDQAETVLLHLCRGSGVQGLAGIPAVRGAVVRPLLGCSRRDIEDYCRACAVPYVTDSTNESTQYRRNAVRRIVLPALRQLNPQIETALARTAAAAARDDAYLTKLAGTERQRLRQPYGLYETAALAALPDALLYRVLALEARALETAWEEHHAVTVMAWLRGGVRAALTLPGGVRASCTPHRFCLTATQIKTALPAPAKVGVSLPLGGYRYVIRPESEPKTEKEQNVHKNFAKCVWDCDKIKGKLRWDARREGDMVRPLGKNRDILLKKWLNEAKIPPERRDFIPLLRDDEGIVAVPGVGVAARVQSDKAEKRLWLTEEE